MSDPFFDAAGPTVGTHVDDPDDPTPFGAPYFGRPSHGTGPARVAGLPAGDDPTYERDFNVGFLRKVLSLGIRTGLHRRLPGALLPAHFAGLSDGRRNVSPRQRLAAILERHAGESSGGWPGVETMDLLVEREAARLRDDEAAALAEEWRAVREVPVTDAAFVEGEVREWAARCGLQRVLLEAADLYESGATSVELRAQLLRALGEADLQPATALAPVGAGAFLGQAFAEPESLVEGLLSDDGGGWIGGEEKLGKSFYMLEEAACLALGLPVCGRFVVPQRRRVLILEEEDSPRRTHRRLRALLHGHGVDPDHPDVRRDLDAWLRVAVWGGFTLDNVGLVEQLRAEVAAHRPAVVYIDCLRKVTVKNLNHADEAGALLAVLDTLRREYGVIFRVIHHFRKQQGFRTGRGSQEIGGSFVLGAWGENSLFFEPVGRTQGHVRVEVQTKDGAPVPAFTLTIASEGPHHAPVLICLTAKEDASDGRELDELVYQAVASLPTAPAAAGEPGVPISAIFACVKGGQRKIRRALERLLEAERVAVTGTGGKQAKLYGVSGE